MCGRSNGLSRPPFPSSNSKASIIKRFLQPPAPANPIVVIAATAVRDADAVNAGAEVAVAGQDQPIIPRENPAVTGTPAVDINRMKRCLRPFNRYHFMINPHLFPAETFLL